MPRLARSAAVRVAAALVGGALLAACGAPAPASIAPGSAAPGSAVPGSGGPSIAPEAAVAAALAERFGDPELTGRVELTSRTAAQGIEIVLVGSLEFDGLDERESYVRTIEAIGVDEVLETVQVGDEEWTRIDPGPWVPSDAEDDRPFLFSLASVEAWTVAATDVRGGELVYRLRPAADATLDPDDWGFDDPAVSDVTFSVSVLASAAGEPLEMSLTFSYDLGDGGDALRVEGANTVVFETLDQPIAIEPPDEAWLAHASDEHGLTIGHPPETTVGGEPGRLDILADGSLLYSVASQTAPDGANVSEFADVLSQSYADELEATVVDRATTTINDVPAIILTVEIPTDDGGTNLLLVAAVVRGGRAQEIFLVGTPATEEQDRGALEAILTTITFRDG